MILYEISAIKILLGIFLIKYSENSGNKVNKHKYTVDAGRSSSGSWRRKNCPEQDRSRKQSRAGT